MIRLPPLARTTLLLEQNKVLLLEVLQPWNLVVPLACLPLPSRGHKSGEESNRLHKPCRLGPQNREESTRLNGPCLPAVSKARMVCITNLYLGLCGHSACLETTLATCNGPQARLLENMTEMGRIPAPATSPATFGVASMLCTPFHTKCRGCQMQSPFASVDRRNV